MSALEQMYQQVIMDHAREGHGRGLAEVSAPRAGESHQVNTTCGDEIRLRLGVDGDRVVGLSWEGQGCSISQASASVLHELVEGATVEEARRAAAAFRDLMGAKGEGIDAEREELLGDAAAFVGVGKYPARVKCALLGWMAFKDALAKAHDGQDPKEGVMSDSKAAPANAADVEEAMRDVIDPELGINVVDLGLVYGVEIDENRHAVIDMTLTSAACPLTDVIEDQTSQALDGVVDGFRINWVWMPPWGPDKITDDGREQLRALGFNV